MLYLFDTYYMLALSSPLFESFLFAARLCEKIAESLFIESHQATSLFEIYYCIAFLCRLFLRFTCSRSSSLCSPSAILFFFITPGLQPYLAMLRIPFSFV